jgi:Asp-tRNA(Asn)/Glu-tRNA(Gln) amidotransferase A subunit family amidase
VGWKPSKQRVPTVGAFPLSRTLDSIGPMARTVVECARADAVMAGETWRELVLEMPYPGEKPTGYISVLERPDVVPAKVEAGIRMAIDGGWKPLSRGRAFHFAIPDEED